MKSFLVGCFYLLLTSFSHLTSQNLQPVKWEFSYHETNDSCGELILKASIEPNWHIYSQTQSGDGPLPTIFKFIKTPEFSLVGSVSEPDPVRVHADVFDADVAMFSIEVKFIQKINRNTKKDFTILGEVECMSCNDLQCLPPRTYKFSIKVPANEL